jgi:hypothetical protein
MVRVLAIVSKPFRGRWIFKGDKSPHHAFLLKESEAVGPRS